MFGFPPYSLSAAARLRSRLALVTTIPNRPKTGKSPKPKHTGPVSCTCASPESKQSTPRPTKFGSWLSLQPRDLFGVSFKLERCYSYSLLRSNPTPNPTPLLTRADTRAIPQPKSALVHPTRHPHPKPTHTLTPTQSPSPKALLPKLFSQSPSPKALHPKHFSQSPSPKALHQSPSPNPFTHTPLFTPHDAPLGTPLHSTACGVHSH